MRISDWSSDVCSSDLLGDLGEGRLALVSSAAGDADFAATSLAAKVQGPLAIRQLLARLHVAETLDQARALQARLGEGESVITRHGERLGAGWVRVLRSGAAKQGALLREREIQSLRSEEHTSELQSLMRISYAVFCLKKKKKNRKMQ